MAEEPRPDFELRVQMGAMRDLLSQLVAQQKASEGDRPAKIVEEKALLSPAERIQASRLNPSPVAPLPQGVAPIGRGDCAVVYEAECDEFSARVAVKRFAEATDGQQEALTRDFMRELGVLRQLRHPNIVNMYGGVAEQGVLSLVLELADCNLAQLLYRDDGDVKGPVLLQQRARLTAATRLSILMGIAAALSYMHRRGCTHRDLVPDHVLIKFDGQSVPVPKLTGFGLSCIRKEMETRSKSGSIVAYLAPELLLLQQQQAEQGQPQQQQQQRQQLDYEAVDVYGFGLLMYEVMGGRPAFGSMKPMELFSAKTEGKALVCDHFSAECPEEVKALMLRCVDPQALQRPSMVQVYGALSGAVGKFVARSSSPLPPVPQQHTSDDDKKAAAPLSFPSTSQRYAPMAFGSAGRRSGQLKCPYGVAIHRGTGEVFVSDANNHRIQVFTPDGKYVRKFGSAGAAEGQLQYPLSIAVNADDNELYVVEKGNHRVSVFAADSGSFVRVAAAVDSVGEKPMGLAFCASRKEILVAALSKKQVVVVPAKGSDGDGGVRRLAVADGEPEMLGIDEARGEVIVGCHGGVVAVLDIASGARLRQIGTMGPDPGQLQGAMWGCCAVHPVTGHVLVPVWEGHVVLVFDRDGGLVRQLGQGTAGEALGEVCCPAGVAIHPWTGEVYVAEYGIASRIQVFAGW